MTLFKNHPSVLKLVLIAMKINKDVATLTPMSSIPRVRDFLNFKSEEGFSTPTTKWLKSVFKLFKLIPRGFNHHPEITYTTDLFTIPADFVEESRTSIMLRGECAQYCNAS